MGGLTQPAVGSQSSPGSGAAPTLRPYQAEAIAAIRSELVHVQSTMLVACTGAGKTVVLADLSRLCVSGALFGVAGRVLILVHRDELVRQTLRKCEAVGLYADVEKGSQRASSLAKVVIASVQSLRGKRLARWARDHFALVIVDECHHAAAKSYTDVLEYFATAKKLGVTATPKRTDGKALGDVFETVAYVYDIRRAIHEQFLVPIVARRIVVESIRLDGIKVRAGDLAQDQLAAEMESERALRGVAIPLLEQARDRSTIVFCASVKHAQDLAEVLNSYRPGCARAAWGGMGDDEREATLAAHAAGEFQIMTNCALLEEGYDSPRASCVAMAAPTLSWARYVQRGGRGLRLLGITYAESVANGKRDCLILDFSGTAGKHSLMGPADCLRGADEELPDDVRAEIERLLGKAQLEIGAVLEAAEQNTAEQRSRIRASAVVNWHAETIDPFIGSPSNRDDTPSNTPHRPEWRSQPASQPQLDALAEEGVNVAKMPQLSRAEAWDLLVRIKGRRRAGLCSYKAARRLASLGVKNTATLTAERAKELIALCLKRGWHPSSLRNEPETLPDYATPDGTRRDVGGAA